MTEILDFTTFIPEPRVARIGSGENVEEVDISFFPAEASLYMIRLIDEKRKTWKDKHPDGQAPAPTDLGLTQDEMVEVVVRACQVSNPKITAAWLKKNCEFGQLTKFCTAMMEIGNEQMNVPTKGDKKEETGKNR